MRSTSFGQSRLARGPSRGRSGKEVSVSRTGRSRKSDQEDARRQRPDARCRIPDPGVRNRRRPGDWRLETGDYLIRYPPNSSARTQAARFAVSMDSVTVVSGVTPADPGCHLPGRPERIACSRCCHRAKLAGRRSTQPLAAHRSRSAAVIDNASPSGASGIRMNGALAGSRGERRPVVTGPNSMGIRSEPGGYDATFIPAERMTPAARQPAPVAVVAQSGAFTLARLDRLPWLRPRYVVTAGNQLDLTIGDYLAHLARGPQGG